jgi:hypothetical protein
MIIDGDMILEGKRYRLTEEYVYNQGYDLNNLLIDEFDTNLSTLARRVLYATSDYLYDYLRNNAVCFRTTEYLIAHNQEWYETMKRALLYQLETFIEKGDDIISEKTKNTMRGMGFFHTKMINIPKEW